MTQEDKQLLIKDLCARLPYGVILHIEDDSGNIIDEELDSIDLQFNEINVEYHLFTDVIQPYLRPMSSMTEEEEDELNSARMGNYGEDVDWLNAHYFDYHIVPSTGKTLIESGFALEALEGMYKTE